MKRLQRLIGISALILGLTILGNRWPGPLLFAAPSTVANGEPVEPTEITVSPTFPTTTDTVQVTLSGVWSHGCVPYDTGHAVVASRIIISMTVPDPETVCGQAVTPWSVLVAFDRLTADIYQIDVQGAVTVTSTMTVLGNQVYLPFISDSASFATGR